MHGMPHLEVATYFGQVFWLIVAFGVLYLFVCKIFVPRSEEILYIRERHISDLLQSANSMKDKIIKLREERRSSIDMARQEAETIKQTIVGNYEQLLEDKMEEMKRVYDTKYSELNVEIKNMANQSDFILQEAVVDYAYFLIHKITNLSPDRQALCDCYNKILEKQ